MRFKTDENLHPDIAVFLHDSGHDAVTVWYEGLRGHPDEEIAAACQREGRALITLDLGFANITAYPPSLHAGIIVLRLANQSRTGVLAVLSRVLPVLDAHGVSGRLWIIDETSIRMRGDGVE